MAIVSRTFFKVETSSGRIFDIVVWTGGSRPQDDELKKSDLYDDFVEIFLMFYNEQIETYTKRCKEFPDREVRALFWDRAQYDAWSTIRHYLRNS